MKTRRQFIASVWFVSGAIAGAGTLLVAGVIAHDNPQTPDETARIAIATTLPGVVPRHVSAAPIDGFLQVEADHNKVLFVSDDGGYVIDGDVYDARSRANLTAAAQASIRRAAIAGLTADDWIRFAPENPKQTLTAFVDVDCPYCALLHSRIGAINAAGVAIDYVFFPLNIHPQASRKARAVWCSPDRAAAFTAAMRGTDPGANVFCKTPVDKTLALANRLGVSGTPTIVDAKGEIVPLSTLMDPAHLQQHLSQIASAR